MPKPISIPLFIKQYWFLILFAMQLEYFAVNTFFTVRQTAEDVKTGQAVDQAVINCLIDHGLNPYKYLPSNIIIKGITQKDAKHEELLTLRIPLR